jgi:hypothetical protein
VERPPRTIGGIDPINSGSFWRISAFELRDFKMEREISQMVWRSRAAQAQFMGMWPRLSTSLQVMLPS